MRGVVKIVALALVLAVLASPAAALVDCLPHGAAMASMECCHGIRTHGSGNPAQVNAAAQRGSCCEISSGRPVGPFVPNAPTTGPANAAPARTVVAVVVPAVPVCHGIERTVPVAEALSPQAVLCTFLI